MKLRDSIRRTCFVAVVTLLCFGPGALAQTRVTSPSTPSFTSSIGVFAFNPIGEEHKRRHTSATEGGSAALYLLLAGLACGSAVLFRSRQTVAAKSV